MISSWRNITLLAPVGGSNGILLPVSEEIKTEYSLFDRGLFAMFSIHISPSPTMSCFLPFMYLRLFFANGSL